MRPKQPRSSPQEARSAASFSTSNSRGSIYGELNKKGDYGDSQLRPPAGGSAKLPELPIVDGKISLPDLRIEYETADGECAHIDLELATENYRPAHMSQKLRAGFKIYGVNSTSRGRRAEWEGRELTAQVLAL